MAEGALPACPIIEDVVGFQPEGQVLTAKAVTAGFPCQDISQAGNQAGLHGHRSSLIKEAFKTYDCLPNAYMMLLENVSALLGMNKECRKVLNYILQAAKKRDLAVFWTTNQLTNVGLPASRRRVFLLLCKNDFTLQQAPPIDHFANLPWNAGNTTPMHKWLVRDNEKRDDHKSRMNSLGNVVVPQQAFLALSVLARMTQGEFFV
ncbi:unnamed protein product [Cladocopium goreaui]|uniref:Modification methylase ScrFIA n=1 Tax=Cladocopium goreaui TaxID=2562237 RepID=A0A9P1DSF5_9DINO|nr:unnamed protein product [Cladocopium goreaui]